MTIQNFYDAIQTSISNKTLIKATLANPRNKNAELKNVFIKLVTLKEEIKCCFVYRNKTNDITKNYSLLVSIEEIKKLLLENFLNADFFLQDANWFVQQKKDGKIKVIKKIVANENTKISLVHNNEKTRLITTNKHNYLFSLGIATSNGDIKKEMQHKFKQINRYVEIVDAILKDAKLNELNIVDMGCGKGYLTFALFDYLQSKNINANVIGIDVRKDLVDKCNAIAQENKFTNLQFKEGNIQNADVKNKNILIALHACDTATDDAIKKGIAADAQIIICAPCCHKQVRNAMQPNAVLQCVTKHGILFERQAELITDSLRALWLESNGYKTKVFDFVDVENTPKNVMIVAVKTKRTAKQLQEYKNNFLEVKAMFGVKWQALENV